VIIRNDASDLSFFASLAGRPAKARRADDVPVERSGKLPANASVRHILSRFLPFTGILADNHKRILLIDSLIFSVSLIIASQNCPVTAHTDVHY